MPKTRILVVDDAVVFRRALTDELSADPALEVVGTAANGRIALARMPQVAPDIVILDVEMPEMDGLTTLAELRKMYPRLPVIMFSALTERGAAATLDALALGATDYFTKPSTGTVDASLEVIRKQLIPKIKAICDKDRGPSTPPATAGRGSSGSRLAVIRQRIDVVAIACSTGGPNALNEVFAALPADLAVPVVLVQHMPPMFTRLLAERLSAQFALRVHEGTADAPIEPGHAWVAPGDFHMALRLDGFQARLVLSQGPPENSCRPAADVLFRSVVKVFGAGTLGVVL